MRKFIAAIIALTLTFSISVPALALNVTDQTNSAEIAVNSGVMTITGSDGNVLEFEIYELSPGVYRMDYYYNGEMDRSYVLSGNDSNVCATTAEGETYTVESTVQTENATMALPAATPYASSVWQSLGNFQYYGVSGIPYPTIEVNTQIYNSSIATKRVTSAAGSLAADVTAAITTAIIAGVLGIVAAPATLAAAVAAALLSDMIATAGGSIVNGVISTAISDTYNIVTNYHYLAALAPQVNTSHNYAFTSAYVSYNGQPYEHQGYDSTTGFTRENWSTTEFGKQAWEDTFGTKGYSYPGVKRVNFYELT